MRDNMILKSNFGLKLASIFRRTLTLMSPTLNTRVVYYVKNRKRINLNNPTSLSEKLQWLKLNRYNHDPLVSLCSDKYRVRDYVQQKGCGDSLNELYNAFDNVEDLRWELLSNQFVLKWNYGSGYNIICKNKSDLDEQHTYKLLNKWRKEKPWLEYAEFQCKSIPPRLLVEKFLDSGSDSPIPDYKIYCFHGRPTAILLMHDRGSRIKAAFFDTNWKKLGKLDKYEDLPVSTPKPISINKMLDYAERLSEPFPFVRVDYYEVDGNLIFGELTFTPSGGYGMSEVEIDGKSMGELLKLS